MRGINYFLLGVSTTLMFFGLMLKHNYMFEIFDEKFAIEYWRSSVYELARIITACMFALTVTNTAIFLFKDKIENENN